MSGSEGAAAIQTAKQDLRRELRARLRAHPPEERARASVHIHERLFRLEAFRRARSVHCYLSLPEEVDTAPILARCAAEGKRVVIPYQIPGEGRLGAALWNARMPLVAGPLGIREPAPEARMPVPLNEIEFVVAPGLAFDRAGGRLGHGKGYYDRFLVEWRATCQAANPGGGTQEFPGAPRVVALAFGIQIVPAVPMELWDIRMDAVLTERKEIANV